MELEFAQLESLKVLFSCFRMRVREASPRVGFPVGPRSGCPHRSPVLHEVRVRKGKWKATQHPPTLLYREDSCQCVSVPNGALTHFFPY